MKRAALFLLVLVLPAAFAVSQDSSAPDPYKPTLDRLDALTRQAEPEWRFHADIPHPEDPGVHDSDWGSITNRSSRVCQRPPPRRLRDSSWSIGFAMGGGFMLVERADLR